MTCPCANIYCELIRGEHDLLKQEHEALLASSEKHHENLVTAQIESESHKEKFEILKNNYDILAVEAKKHQDVASIALLNPNAPIRVSPAAVNVDLYNSPLCTNPACQAKHENYVALVQDYNDATANKTKYFDMLNRTIKGNQERFKTDQIAHESTLRKFEQQSADLLSMRMRYGMLKQTFLELQQTRVDPFCRDEEILKLRNELAKAKDGWAERNTTAVNANRDAAHYIKCYEEQSSLVNDMKIDIAKCKNTISSQHETIEAFRKAQPEELRTRPVGVCIDFKCGCIINGLKDSVYSARNESLAKDATIQELKEERNKFKQNSSYWKQQHDSLVNGNHADGAQMTTHKRMHEDISVAAAPKSRELQAKLTNDLDTRFRILFDVNSFCSAGLDENTLYDNFFLDQPEKERLDVLEELFAVCHDGNRMPERDRKKYKYDLLGEPSESSRIGKRSFAACLKALGGVSKRKNNTIFWTNVHMRRQPMCMRTKLE